MTLERDIAEILAKHPLNDEWQGEPYKPELEVLVKEYEKIAGIPDLATARVFVESIPHYEDDLYDLYLRRFTVGAVIQPRQLFSMMGVLKHREVGRTENGVPIEENDFWLAIDVPIYMITRGSESMVQEICAQLAEDERVRHIEYAYYPTSIDLPDIDIVDFTGDTLIVAVRKDDPSSDCE